MFRLFFQFIILLLIAFGCNREHISVQTHYLSRSDLASFHIGTPDPQLHRPLVGQRLVVHWNFPKTYSQYSDLHFKLTLRFKNHAEMVREVEICPLEGFYIYRLMGGEFEEYGGIRTYKLEVMGDGELLESWYHQLWVELITVGQDR